MSVLDYGVLVGCDANREWLLPWWWRHYSSCNSAPVAFADFGMSLKAISWCQERGIYLPLPKLSPLFVPPQRQKELESLYGDGVFDVRDGWMQKPLACLHTPFTFTLWLDLDTEVRKDITPLLNSLNLGIEIALVREEPQHGPLLAGEILYNSGVIAFRKGIPILQTWLDLIHQSPCLLLGDQDYLSRVIFLHSVAVLELPVFYNLPYRLYPTVPRQEEVVIRHFCESTGKIALLELASLDSSDFFNDAIAYLKNRRCIHK